MKAGESSDELEMGRKVHDIVVRWGYKMERHAFESVGGAGGAVGIEIREKGKYVFGIVKCSSMSF